MASSAKEKKYRGPRPKRVPAMAPEFDKNGHQTRKSMMYGRIDPAYLTRLLMEYKAVMDPFVLERNEVAKTDPDAAAKMVPPQMSDHLGICIDIVIKKTLGIPRWRDYSPPWKEEMYAHALMLILRYIHRFDPKKVKSDPFFYAGMIAWNACNQVWNTLNRQAQRIKYIPLVEGIYHSVISMDQYAGVLEKEEKRKADKKRADVVNGTTAPVDDAVEMMKEIDEAAGIHLEEDWAAELNMKRIMKKAQAEAKEVLPDISQAVISLSEAEKTAPEEVEERAEEVQE